MTRMVALPASLHAEAEQRPAHARLITERTG